MIDKTTNISNDCLYDCKEQMRECVLSSNLNINCDEATNALRERIDISKFKAWLDKASYSIQSKENRQAYFNKAFLNELEKGTFKLEIPSVSYNSLIQALRDKGVTVLSDDTCYLEIMWNWMFAHGLDLKASQDLNHKIVDYMKEGQTFADYLELVKKSKLIRAMTVDWDAIQTEYQKALDEWDELFKMREELEKEEDESYGES